MDNNKIEFLDLKKCSKNFFEEEKQKNCDKDAANFSKSVTNPIMNAFLDFKKTRKFNIKDL